MIITFVVLRGSFVKFHCLMGFCVLRMLQWKKVAPCLSVGMGFPCSSGACQPIAASANKTTSVQIQASLMISAIFIHGASPFYRSRPFDLEPSFAHLGSVGDGSGRDDSEHADKGYYIKLFCLYMRWLEFSIFNFTSCLEVNELSESKQSYCCRVFVRRVSTFLATCYWTAWDRHVFGVDERSLRWWLDFSIVLS